MEVSLVICTRDRAPRLRQCLESLRRLSAPFPWEVVIVDNGSSDETSAVIAEFAASSSRPVVSVVEPAVGASRGRNAGWKASSGAILAFIDDDCYPAEDFLTSLHACFAEDARLGFVGGRVLLFDPTDFPITIQVSEIRHTFEPGSFIPAGTIHGANLSFRREAMAAVGGFDPRLGAGTRFPCEDVDAMARVSGAQWLGIYDPRPLVLHHHGRKGSDSAVLLRSWYNRGRGAYYAKSLLNPTLRKRYFKEWFTRMRWQPKGRTVQEVAGAVDFLLVNFMRRTPRPEKTEIARA